MKHFVWQFVVLKVLVYLFLKLFLLIYVMLYGCRLGAAFIACGNAAKSKLTSPKVQLSKLFSLLSAENNNDKVQRKNIFQSKRCSLLAQLGVC